MPASPSEPAAEPPADSPAAQQMASASDRAAQAPSLRGLLVRTLVFTVVVVAGVALAGWLFGESLRGFAAWMVGGFGMAGVFAGVFIADAFTFPLPPDTYLFLGVASETPALPILITASVASVVGGSVAYAIGPHIQRIPVLRARVESFRERGERLFARYGVWAVGIGALTPVPFSVVAWMAGMYRMGYRRFFVASLLRVPRIVGYYWLYELGWAPAV